MAEAPSERTPLTGLLARLARTRAFTRAAMVVERLWPLVLPFVLVVCVFLSLSWFGLFRLMPDWTRFAIVGLLGLAALAALWPLRLFRRPLPAEIDRRIERANRLEHAPVSTQADQVAVGGVFADTLWREHQKRMAERLGRLGSDLPRTRVPERDPWGVRALIALLVVTGFAFSLGPFGGGIGDAFRAHAGRDVIPPRIDAWITPPSYTGRAPIFLTAEANRETASYTVPENSALSVRVTGGTGNETLVFQSGEDSERQIAPDDTATATDADARQFSGLLTQDGTLALRRGARDIEGWGFTVVRDEPPHIRFAGEPDSTVNGTLQFAYEIEDDYGAARGEALVERADSPADARPLYEAPEMPLSLPPGGGREIAAEASRDLTEHPWAGSTVNLTLEASDDAGQTAQSETKTVTLPERPFTNPLAKALIEQRRMLALDANTKPRVLSLLDAITVWPEETIENASHYLGLVTARSRLDAAGTDEALRGVVDYMWEVALGIEEGDMSEAEKRLSQAREALRQALEEGAGEEEIERLMDELRAAMQEFMREFAERAMQNKDFGELPEAGESMRQSDLERMLDQIEDLAKSGAREEAEQLLSQLEDMMNNMQAARPQGQQGEGQQSEMRQQMDELGEIMRRQQEMMDETFQLDQWQQGQRGQQGQEGEQGQGQEGQDGQGMTPEEFAEAMRRLQEGQGDLQGQLEGLMEGLEGFGLEPGEGFGEAGEAMGEAEGALGRSEGERAVGEQGRALEALRRGAQDMMNQMQQAMQGQDGQGMEGGRQRNIERDPLGRPRATTGPDFGESVDVPDEIDIQRAREILEAIRQRLGDALSPELEKEYLERLLDMQ